MRSIGFPQISACLYVEMEMVGRTKREMTKSMELEVELVHRQLTNSKRSVKNGMSSLFTPNVFSKYWNQLKSHEITIQIYTVSFQNLGHDASFRRISSLWIWSGHWGGLRPRGSAEQGSMCCHRRNLALNPRWKSLKHRKRMEENGREVKMVKTQANCIKLYQIVREVYHALRACSVWLGRKTFRVSLCFNKLHCLPHIPSAPVRCLKGSKERRSSTVDSVVFCKLHSKLPQVQTWGTRCSRWCLEAPEGSDENLATTFRVNVLLGNLKIEFWNLGVVLWNGEVGL